ncbi:MAG TPA: hypothetical protein VK548_19035 [Candidatus Acidoferrum sp.]|nr:hypothetical protein [Candidatus Acidoferrum sp.]
MTKNKALTIVGTVLLGALGSGLWEFVRPALTVFWSVALTIVTLGLDALRDDIYRDVARGLEEKSARLLLSSAAGVLLGLVLGFMTRAKLRKPDTGDALRRILDRAAPIMLMLAVMFSLMAARQSYITSSIANLLQLEAIAAPFLTDQERLFVRSRFAQITTRAEYVALTDELKRVALRHGQKVPRVFTF